MFHNGSNSGPVNDEPGDGQDDDGQHGDGVQDDEPGDALGDAPVVCGAAPP
jgi:hypothetical protein